MRLTELHIEGFGRLANRHLRFTPGLNLIYGPNDAGKSTLQRAVVALLYGLDGQGALLHALKPWDERSAYAASLTYCLDDGQGFRVSRRFYPRPETRLLAHPEGVEVTGRFRTEPQGRLCFADEHLGLAQEVFAGVCLLWQGGRHDLPVSAVTEALLQVLAAAPPDVATAKAIERLEAAMVEQVASADGRNGPLPQALARRADLEDERQRVLAARSELLARARALHSVGLELDQLELQHEQLLLLQRRAERAGLHTQSAASESSGELERCRGEVARWQAWSGFPAHSRDDLLRLSAQRNQLLVECRYAAARAQEAEQQLATLSAQRVALEERLASLLASSEAHAEQSAEIQALAGEWRAATEAEEAAEERWQTARTALDNLERRVAAQREPLERLLPIGPAGVNAAQKRLHEARQRLSLAKTALSEATAQWARLGIDEAEFQAAQGSNGASPVPALAPEPEPAGPLLSRLLRRLGQSDGESRPEGPSYADAQPLYAELLRCRIEVNTAQQALRDTEAATLWQMGDLLGGSLGEHAFARLSERLAVHLRAESELEHQRIAVAGMRADLERARERTNSARRALCSELKRLGYDQVDPGEALAALEQAAHTDASTGQEALEYERQRLRAEAELERLQIRAEVLERDVQGQQERQAALAQVEEKLIGLFDLAGISASVETLEAACEAFEEGYQNHLRWEKAQAALETAQRWHRTLQGAQAGAEADAERLCEIDTRLQAMGITSPWSAHEPDRAADEYAPLIRETEGRIAAARQEREHLEAKVDQATTDLRHLAELDEELASVRAAVRHLERFRAALSLARDELVAAGLEHRKQYGPRLEILLHDALQAVSPGCYSGVSVDPHNLAVSLRVPGCEAPLPAESVGGSTSEMLRLLLRLALARLLGQSRETLPLLLDEPLAHCDTDHLQRALDYLLSQAENTQILLFSRDERIRAHLREPAAQSPLHQEIVLQ